MDYSITRPPLAKHSLLVIYVQPLALHLLCPLQALSGVAHSLEPLQVLQPVHLTKASHGASPQREEQPVANNAAAAAARARAVLDVRFIEKHS
jgi:hypothetical protein